MFINVFYCTCSLIIGIFSMSFCHQKCHLELVDIEARVSFKLIQLELVVSINVIELLH